jgi:THO complex subunit 1
VKDSGYNARFIFIGPPEAVELERRLKQKGSETEEKIQGRIETARQKFEQATVEGVHDKVLVNGDSDSTLEELEKYVFGSEEDQETGDSASAEQVRDTPAADNEVEMLDGNVPALEETSKEDAPAATETEKVATEQPII